ncbi:MAG: PAS domain S-box protein [Acidobacteriia bacterium]|nr:PAS domain S-box protein [Terriglobia bacterium]
MSLHDTLPPPDSRPHGASRGGVFKIFEQFDRRQHLLWRSAFFLLLALALGLTWSAWQTSLFATFPARAIPLLVVLLVVVLGLYLWKKTEEITSLRRLLRELQTRDSLRPSGKQLDYLYEIITRSQQSYRELIDSFDEILIALTPEGQIRAANRSFIELIGKPFQQVIGKPFLDLLDAAEAEGVRMNAQVLPQFLARRHWSGAVMVRVKGKPERKFYDCVAHAMIRGDKVQGITILARDITSLRENEARFTELFTTLQEGIYISTPGDLLLDANPALVSMLGYESREALLARPFSELFADPSEQKELQREAGENRALRGREITLRRRDGTPLTCLNTVTAVRDASGAVVRYQGAVMDISERRAIERKLHKEQEFARRLMESFPDLILVLNTSGQYTFVSPRIHEVLGYDPEEVERVGMGNYTHEEDRHKQTSLLQEIMAGRQKFGSFELRVRHKSGEWRLMRCHVSPLVDESGNIEGVVISARDITQLKRLEDQLVQSERLAAMGQMLAGVAHELNNPLTAILGITELLRDQPETSENAKRQLELSYRQARRAARIVQNLLDFSRPAAPQKKPLDVSALVERAVQLQEHSLRRNNISLQFTPTPGLPLVLGDANQLIQILLNLVTNAEQAIREVRDSGRIEIDLRSVGDNVTIRIRDDGPGIKPDVLPKIFDPFYTTKRPGGGTGLGLSISQAIIREHHGRIEAAAHPKGGTVFTVLLPALPESQATPSPLDTAVISSAGLRQMANILKDRSLLVLDDEESIRMLLQEGLTAQGLRVDCTATGEEALALARKNVYEVLLCDLNLDGGKANGRKFARQICELQARKPFVVFMTGDLISPPPVGSAAEREFHLQKPFRISQVLSILAEAFIAAEQSGQGK